MPSFDLIPLLIQTGFAGLFVFLFLDTRRETRERESAWNKEREERHAEFMRLHRELVELQKETLSTMSGIKLVMQQLADQSRPPFTDWDGATERRNR